MLVRNTQFVIEAALLFDLLAVDGHAALVHFDELGIITVADQPFWVISDALFKCLDNRFPGRRILSLLPGVTADDIASAIHKDFLHRQRRRVLISTQNGIYDSDTTS